MHADAPYPPVAADYSYGYGSPDRASRYTGFTSYGSPEPAWTPSYWSAPHSYGDASPYTAAGFGSYGGGYGGYSGYGGGYAGGYGGGYGGYAAGYGYSSAYPQYDPNAPPRGGRPQLEGPRDGSERRPPPVDEPRPSPPKSKAPRSVKDYDHLRTPSEAPSALSRGSNWSMYSAYLPKELRPQPRRPMSSSLVKAHKNEHIKLSPEKQLRDVTPGEDDQSFISTYFSKERQDRRVRIDPPSAGAPSAPPDPRSRLTLVESLVMLKAHDQGVFQDHERLLDYILCGGLILELLSLGRIEIHPNTIRYPTELSLRVSSDEPVHGELLQGAMDRMELVTRSQYKAVPALINLLYMGLKESISKNVLNRCVNKGWLRESSNGGRRAEYKIANQQVYEEARRAIDDLMDMRDNDREPPVRYSVLGTMYWAPQDYTNYCFGRSREGYPAQQLCKAFIFAVQKFAERL